MARKKKAAMQDGSAPAPADAKHRKKLNKAFDQMEKDIDHEFKLLMESEGYPFEELDSLRWDYRLERAEQAGLSREEIEYFVAAKEAEATGGPAPAWPGAAPAAAAASQRGGASIGTEEYKRKSEVDLALVEKYLDRKVSRTSEHELSSVYKAVFGEELHIPEQLALADYTPRASDLKGAPKLTKAEVFGAAEGAPAEEKKEEAAVEAAPAAKRESRALGVAMAWRRGVPQGPTRDEKWSVWNPARFWLIPKRLAGQSVPKFYVLFGFNLIFFIAQFALLLIPFILRSLVTGIRWIWRRFLKQRVAPAMKSLKEKVAVPPAAPSEAEKKPSGAKSS